LRGRCPPEADGRDGALEDARGGAPLATSSGARTLAALDSLILAADPGTDNRLACLSGRTGLGYNGADLEGE
jgi:hypothetical protein